MTKDTGKPACLMPDCSTPAATRGLCKSDYEAISRRVRAGEYTWAELVEKGKVLPSQLPRSVSRIRKYLDE